EVISCGATALKVFHSREYEDKSRTELPSASRSRNSLSSSAGVFTSLNSKPEELRRLNCACVVDPGFFKSTGREICHADANNLLRSTDAPLSTDSSHDTYSTEPA